MYHPTRVTIEEASRLFRRGATPFPTLQVVVFHDSHRRMDRVVRFTGLCVVCDRPTWCADDGDNDPRGVLGDGSLHPVELEDNQDVVIRLCAVCGNDHHAYLTAQAMGRTHTGRTLAPQPAALPRRRRNHNNGGTRP